MEANEAMQRIFWRHRWLLVILLLLPVAAVSPLLLSKPVTYAATASIQAQSAAPDAETQVTAILSRVTAVATSPTVVQTAINAAGVSRNALTVSRRDIAVSSLSTSAVVTLTVTDSSPQVAILLSRALATAVVNVLNKLGTQSSAELAALATQRTQLTIARDKLLRQMAVAQANHQLANSAGVQSLIAQLNAIEAQMSANVSSVQQVLSASTVNQGAGVISASAYATSVSRHVASYAALAGLLGLIIGLLIATMHELARPTIAEPSAGARELGLVLLGNAEQANGELAGLDDDLTTRLDLAAHRLGARTLVLTGPVPPAQLSTLAAHLDESLPAIGNPANGDGPGHAGSPVAEITPLSAHVLPGAEQRTGAAGEPKSPTGSFGGVGPHTLGAEPARSRLTVAALPDITLRGRPKIPALVLVLPRFAPRAALDQAVDLGVATGWPILGVIGLRQHRRMRRRRRRAEQRPPAAAETKLSAAAEPRLWAADAEPRLSAAAEPKLSAAAEPKLSAAADKKATARENTDHQGATQ